MPRQRPFPVLVNKRRPCKDQPVGRVRCIHRAQDKDFSALGNVLIEHERINCGHVPPCLVSTCFVTPPRDDQQPELSKGCISSIAPSLSSHWGDQMISSAARHDGVMANLHQSAKCPRTSRRLHHAALLSSGLCHGAPNSVRPTDNGTIDPISCAN